MRKDSNLPVESEGKSFPKPVLLGCYVQQPTKGGDTPATSGSAETFITDTAKEERFCEFSQGKRQERRDLRKK
eukprot:m.8048 g.8048  ORF g.8048 m.8048 type:complete len:73 (+) comp20293_c0_seq1:420-638(+)